MASTDFPAALRDLPEDSQPRHAAKEHASPIQRLAHDLRQPLSSIESIAYYLDMVLGDDDPGIVCQCELLRRMVEHANWIIEDATLASRLGDCACEPIPVCPLLNDIGERMALQEERNLELVAEPGLPPASLPSELASVFFQHILSFFRGVACAQDPIRVRVTGEPSRLHVEVSAAVESDRQDLPSIIDPPGQGGGVRGFVETCGGELLAGLTSGVLSVQLWLPVA